MPVLCRAVCVYGGGLSGSLSIQMGQQAAEQLLRTKQVGSKVQLDLDGKRIPVQIKEKTRAITNSKIDHIQFQALQPDQKVNSVAHIVLKNTDTVSGVLSGFSLRCPSPLSLQT